MNCSSGISQVRNKLKRQNIKSVHVHTFECSCFRELKQWKCKLIFPKPSKQTSVEIIFFFFIKLFIFFFVKKYVSKTVCNDAMKLTKINSQFFIYFIFFFNLNLKSMFIEKKIVTEVKRWFHKTNFRSLNLLSTIVFHI